MYSRRNRAANRKMSDLAGALTLWDAETHVELSIYPPFNPTLNTWIRKFCLGNGRVNKVLRGVLPVRSWAGKGWRAPWTGRCPTWGTWRLRTGPAALSRCWPPCPGCPWWWRQSDTWGQATRTVSCVPFIQLRTYIRWIIIRSVTTTWIWC